MNYLCLLPLRSRGEREGWCPHSFGLCYCTSVISQSRRLALPSSQYHSPGMHSDVLFKELLLIDTRWIKYLGF